MSRLRRNKKGFTLLEVLIAGVILAVVLVGFLQGLNVTLLGTDRDSKMNSALHVAQSQMEYIKSLPFNAGIEASCTCSKSAYCNSSDNECCDEPYEHYDFFANLPNGFGCGDTDSDIIVTVGPVPDYGNMSRIQLITVTVSYNNTNLASQDYNVVLKGYKIDR